MYFGKLERVPARELWLDDRSLAAWLVENLTSLADALGVELTGARLWAGQDPLGPHLLATRAGAVRVGIVCQTEPGADEHLARILAFLAQGFADEAVWVSVQPHRTEERAIEWLNTSLGGRQRLYLAQLEVFRIGEAIAPGFTGLVMPPEEPAPATRGAPGAAASAARQAVGALEVAAAEPGRESPGLSLKAYLPEAQEEWHLLAGRFLELFERPGVPAAELAVRLATGEPRRDLTHFEDLVRLLIGKERRWGEPPK